MIYWPVPVIALAIFLWGNRRYRWLCILYKTLPRDLKAAYRFTKLNWRISKWMKNEETVPKIFNQLVKKHPKKVMLYYQDESWTYEQLEEFSNQVAHYFKSKGYKKGDTIALLLENRPEYVGIWLGLSKIGVIAALINTNLVSDPLIHSIKVADSKGIIYGSDFSEIVPEIFEIFKDLKRYQFGKPEETLSGSLNLGTEIANQSKAPVPDVSGIVAKDKIMYIYTSGTTGLPKAAVITHTRYMYAAVGIYSLANLSPNDVYYNPLPLYHTAGGMLAVGQALIFGLTVALRKKFSATNYWIDCQKYNCTVANYIGEICRYLLTVHKGNGRIEHPVKKMIGNGLRPQIWNAFIDTFHIENVYEFYGSTEGNSNLINIDNKSGAVGFVPRYAGFIYPLILIRCDEETGKPIRNPDGFCSRCELDEPGVLVGKINQKKVHTEFGGYADRQATEKKMLRDVFKKGDLYFNSGDVLSQDELGYYYFKDRTGDTFRWKGENVSTNEIEAVISNVAKLKDTVVYGVQIPGSEGRAGMAAIVDKDRTLDVKSLAKGLRSNLPVYAIPVFLRITESLPMTGTFKLKKMDMQREGFDYCIIKEDHLYYFDAKLLEYLPLTREIYEDIISGRMRL